MYTSSSIVEVEGIAEMAGLAMMEGSGELGKAYLLAVKTPSGFSNEVAKAYTFNSG